MPYLKVERPVLLSELRRHKLGEPRLEDGAHDVATEHRLTRVEGKIDSGMDGIHKRLDVLNGKVSRHEEYINDAKLTARELKGFAEGRTALRKKDLAILGTVITILGLVIQFIPDIIRFLGGSSGS